MAGDMASMTINPKRTHPPLFHMSSLHRTVLLEKCLVSVSDADKAQSELQAQLEAERCLLEDALKV
jgi:hypothetical protein